METSLLVYFLSDLEGDGWEILAGYPPKHMGQESPEKLGLVVATLQSWLSPVKYDLCRLQPLSLDWLNRGGNAASSPPSTLRSLVHLAWSLRISWDVLSGH